MWRHFITFFANQQVVPKPNEGQLQQIIIIISTIILVVTLAHIISCYRLTLAPHHRKESWCGPHWKKFEDPCSSMSIHLLCMPGMGLYIVYIGPSPDYPLSIVTLTHCVINVDNIVVLLFIGFGHVHSCIHTGFLYSPLSLMYFKTLWSHVHSWPYLVSYQISLSYQNPNLILLLFFVWLLGV